MSLIAIQMGLSAKPKGSCERSGCKEPQWPAWNYCFDHIIEVSYNHDKATRANQLKCSCEKPVLPGFTSCRDCMAADAEASVRYTQNLIKDSAKQMAEDLATTKGMAHYEGVNFAFDRFVWLASFGLQGREIQELLLPQLNVLEIPFAPLLMILNQVMRSPFGFGAIEYQAFFVKVKGMVATQFPDDVDKIMAGFALIEAEREILCKRCHVCIDKDPPPFGQKHMVLCVVCGSKRCPKASNHRHLCNNSNEPGQKGSTYPPHRPEGFQHCDIGGKQYCLLEKDHPGKCSEVNL